MVNVGIVSYNESVGCLKKQRGRLPVQVKDNANVIDLKVAAIEKYSKHDQQFCGLEDYVLLYQDLSDDVFLPGTRLIWVNRMQNVYFIYAPNQNFTIMSLLVLTMTTLKIVKFKE